MALAALPAQAAILRAKEVTACLGRAGIVQQVLFRSDYCLESPM